MRIDPNLCDGHQKCVPICPVNAIYIGEERGGKGKKAYIDLDRCVECYACLRSNVCPTKAIKVTLLEWPREIRHSFSAVKTLHKSTNVPGRGTEEMKTNDVTGRFKMGYVGISVEMGRPGVGTSFKDVEKVSMSVAKHGVEFEPQNPVTTLMVDMMTGKLNPEILSERSLSAIIEFVIREKQFPEVIKTLREVSKDVDTVFTVGAISKIGKDGRIPLKDMMDKMGLYYRPNGKINLGLGKPSYNFQ